MKTNVITRFAAAAMVLAAVACQQDELLDGGAQNGPQKELTPLTIKATLEDGAARTALQAGGKVYWENGDAMTVLAVGDGGVVTSYKFTTTDEGAEATFTNDNVALAENYYAVYPHNDVARFPYLVDQSAQSKAVNIWKHTVSNNTLNTYLPSYQKAAQGASEAFDALSAGKVTSEGEVFLKNIGGLIEINIQEPNIKNVILYGNNNESIVGNIYSAFGEDGLPVISSIEGSNMVRIVPATGTVFTEGKYYINIAPTTFANGLSVIFTRNDAKWASVRSSDQFVVERSKISPLPAISNLTFGGQVVDILFCNDAGTNSVPVKESFPTTSTTNAGIVGTYTVKNTVLILKIYGTTQHYRNTGAKAGLNFGKDVNDYVELPAIPKKALAKVVVQNGDMYGKRSGNPVIKTVKSTPVLGCTPWTGTKAQGLEHIWSLAGDPETSYRIAISEDIEEHCVLKQIRLYYADAPEGESSFKPLITSVTTAEPETDPTNGKATLNGSFTAVDCNLSAVTCGFDYKLVSEQEWTSVSCPQTSSEFSYEFTASSSEDYVYRAWTKVNATGKTIYGSEIQFNPCKLVLHLVFHGQEGRDLLVNTWKWDTNGNNSSTKKGYDMNNQTYDFEYNGVDYPFTFWALQSGADKDGVVATTGGYCFRHTDKVPNEALCLSNLGKDYATDGHPAWMQFPGPTGMKLIEVNAELKNSFSGHICTAVNEDGTWAGDSLAEYADKKSFPISLENTSAGVRYYFTTEHLELPRMLSLTLTYLYVGE